MDIGDEGLVLPLDSMALHTTSGLLSTRRSLLCFFLGLLN